MNESENMSTHEDEIINLKARLWEVEDQVKQQEWEIIAYERRLWKQYEDLVVITGVIREIEKILGKDRLQKIYLDYLENQKAEAMKRQREMAKVADFGVDFENIFHLSE